MFFFLSEKSKWEFGWWVCDSTGVSRRSAVLSCLSTEEPESS